MVLTRDFLSQVGTASVSVAAEVAEVQRLLKASGLKYTMHSAGTTVGKLSFPPKNLCCVCLFIFIFHLLVLLEFSWADGVKEGSWDEVMTVIGKAHAVVHQRGVLRVQSSMRVGTR